jgi:hypothetical protein
MTVKRKINQIILYCLFLTFILVSLFFSSCKKRKAFNEENATDATHVGTFRAETDAVIEDINNVISNQFLLRGKGLAANEMDDTNGSGICGLSLDTTKILSKGTVTLFYTGEPCKNRKRAGSVVASIIDYPLKKWTQTNCTLKVDFKAFTVTGVNDGQSLKIEGTIYMINESGSTWYDLRYLNVPVLVNQLSGNDVVVLADGKSLVLNIKRRYTYTISGDVISCKVEGLGEQNGKTNLESWGLTVDNNNFTSQVVEPIIWKTSCGPFAPTEGQTRLNVDNKYFELLSTYGMDGNGDKYSGTGCSTSWKVNWMHKKKTNKRIFPYLR